MYRIKIDNDEYELPSHWDELTLDQLRYFAQMVKEDRAVMEAKLYMMLYCLHAHIEDDSRVFGRKMRLELGVAKPTVRMRIGRRKYELEPEDYVSLAELFRWMFKCVSDGAQRAVPAEYVVNATMERNPLPRVRVWGMTYRGACEGMMDITFEQYILLQTYLDGMASKNCTLEDALACVWHRKKEWNADRVEKDAEWLKRLPADVKMIMFWFIESSLKGFAEMYPRVFRGGGDGPQNRGNVLDAQMRLLDHLAQHDVTKKDTIRRSNILDVFYSLDETVREQEEMEKMRHI